MQNHSNDIRDALRTFQSERQLFAIAVYVIDGDYAIKIASEGA